MKTLRLKDTKEYVVLEASIPEGYGTSQCPQILADTADFEGLKHCCPLVDFSNMELVDVYIRVKCNDKLKVNQTVQPEEDFHCRPDYDQPTHPAPPPQSDKMGVARETEKLLILVKKYRDTMYLEEEVAKYLTEFASRNSAPVDAEKNDNLIDEINNEITNVHEHMEGRYELNGSDLFNIHHLLCRFQNMLMK